MLAEALITGIVAIIVCMINNACQRKRVKEANEETAALIDYKLSELAKQVDKHNNIIERTYILEEKIKVANHRIEDLERGEEKK